MDVVCANDPERTFVGAATGALAERRSRHFTMDALGSQRSVARINYANQTGAEHAALDQRTVGRK